MPGVKGRSGGHNAKPVKAHKLAGTFQKVRHAGVRNPEAPEGLPTSPKPLDGDAAAEWERMLDRLSALKTLSSVDDGALYQYCRLFAETEAIAVTQAETAASIEIVEENLHGFENKADLVAAFQEITKLRQLEARYTTQIRQGRMALRTFLLEFGLTPASRGRVKLPEKPSDTDPFAEFDAPTTH